MFQKLRHHCLLAFIFLVLTFAQQYGFYAWKGFPIVFLSVGKTLSMLVFFILFTLNPTTWLRYGFLSLFIILNFFQMAHLSYFGTQILPAEILLLFTQFHEISGTLTTELHHVLIPLIFTLVPLFFGLVAINKFNKLYSFKIIPLLISLYFIYNPVRTYITGNTWGRQPSTRELAGMNVYLSTSYFLGKILPSKLNSQRYSIQENESLKLKLEDQQKSEWDNIIVVLGESHTPHNMSLFGYDRPTTEFLNSVKHSPQFFHTVGLSSGVSTDISVAFLLNMGYGDAGSIKAAKGEHCLFRLAKKNGFKTHFLSSQSGQQLRYITPYLCSAYLDDFRGLEEVSPQTIEDDAAIDRDLLPKLGEILAQDNGHFIMLHQRGSHGPWPLRFTKESIKFTDNKVDQRINDYDNSIVEFDQFWKELYAQLSKSKAKTLVIYLSDHGESVGLNNKWGHGFLGSAAFEIPIFVFAFNADLPKRTRDLPLNLPQYNLSLFLAREIGYKTNQNPHTIMQDFVIYGNDIDGFAGKAEIKFGPMNKYEYKVIQ